MEQFTIFDFEKLYGKEHLFIAKSFNLDERPFIFPHTYKKLIEVLLYHHASRYGQNAYLKTLQTYNEDVLVRFKNYIQMISYLVPNLFDRLAAKLGGFLYTENDFLINDEYTSIFRNKNEELAFKQESDLESVFIEAIADFEYTDLWDESKQKFKIKNQEKLSNGTADILVTNGNRAIIFELKKGTAKRKDLYQVFDYSISNELKGVAVEPVLLAKEFSEDAIELANILGISCISYQIGYNHSDPYFLLLISKENDVPKNRVFNRYINNAYDGLDVFDEHVVLYEFIHPKFSGSLKDFYLKKVDELNAQIDLIDKLIQRSKQILSV
ncbi:hypothetical protein ABEV20_03860 [Bhargavaea massiliensis]